MWTALDEKGRIVWWWFKPKESNCPSRTTILTVCRIDPPASSREKRQLKNTGKIVPEREVLQ